MTSPALLDAIREFTTTIVNPYDLQELLHRLCDRAGDITRSQGAGIMLAGRQRLGFAAASGDRIIQMEQVQDREHSGACYEAFVTDKVVVVEDLATVNLWPDYQAAALDLGLRSVLGVPMKAAGETIGVLNVYRELPGPWTQEDVDAAEILTGMGAGYVLHANRLRAQHDLTDQLQTALESRDTIGQAKGVLMARYGMSSEEAFARLRSLSQDTNAKLRDVAAGILEQERRHATA